MRTPVVAATSAAVGAAVGVLAGITVADAERIRVELGDLSGWLQAAGTVAALVYAGRQLGHDVKARREDEMRAARVDAKKVYLRRSGGVDRRLGGDGQVILTVNTSAAVGTEGPSEMHDVRLRSGWGDLTMDDHDYGDQPAGWGDVRQWSKAWPEPEAPPQSGRLWATLEWTDDAGRRWHLDESGVLRPSSPSRGRMK